MITVMEFVQKYDGQPIDVDRAYGNQLNVPVALFGLFTGFNSFIKVFKSSKVYRFILNFYGSHPQSVAPKPRYTSNPRGIICPESCISNVGRVSTYPKVLPTIIKGISINMVNIFLLGCFNNQSVQVNQGHIGQALLKVKLISVLRNTPFATTITMGIENLKSLVIKCSYKFTMLFTKYRSYVHITKSNQVSYICQ